MAERFSPEQTRAALATLPQWRFESERDSKRDPQCDAIARQFVFADFVQAFGFMAQVALAAERLGQHPEWSNVYDRVDIVLTTHDALGLTQLDIELARCADAAYASVHTALAR